VIAAEPFVGGIGVSAVTRLAQAELEAEMRRGPRDIELTTVTANDPAVDGFIDTDRHLAPTYDVREQAIPIVQQLCR
jgi:hypothetical protein